MRAIVVSVGEVSEQLRGVTYKSSEAIDRPEDGYVPVLRAGNITQDGISYDDLVYVPAQRVSRKQRLRKGDVLIAASSGSLDVVGKASRIKSDTNATFGAFCKVLRPAPSVDDSYFAYFFQTRSYRQRISALAAGININNLRNEHLNDLQIPLPPLAEQRRIAAILDQAEALRAKRRRAIERRDSLTQSIFLEMFGDPVTNPKGWLVTNLGDVGKLDRGTSRHRPRNAPELLGGPYPLIQTGEVANCDGYIRSYTATYSEIGLKQSKMWKAGTLCITIAANIAKTGILTFDACFPDSVVGFRPNDLATAEFARVWLGFLQESLEANAPESAQKNINLAILRALPIALPPASRRLEFAERVGGVERLRAFQQTSLHKQDSLFTSLQHRAFAGEL